MRLPSLLLAAAIVAPLLAPRLAHADDPAMPPPPPVSWPEPAAPPAPHVVDAPEPAELPPPSAPLATSRMVSSWYGWETLAADGASVGLLSLAIVSDNKGMQEPFALGGIVGLGLGAPIVHAAHGRWGIAAADLGMRVGAVLLGGLVGTGIGAATCSPAESAGFLGCLDNDGDGAVAGATVGAVVASVIDASVLAREKVKVEEEPTPAFAWSPSVRMVKDGAVAGVGGTF